MKIFRLKKIIGVGLALMTMSCNLNAQARARIISEDTVINAPSSLGLQIARYVADINVTVTSTGSLTSRASGIAYESGLSSGNAVLIEGNVTILNVDSYEVGLYYGIQINGESNGTITNRGIIDTKSWAIYTYGGDGTVTNDTTGVLNGNLDIGSTGLVTNRGTINLLGAVNSTIAGDYTQSTSGTLGIDTNITGANTETHSTLTVDGTATLEDGTHLRVDISGTDANQSAFFTAGSTLADVISAGILNVNVDTLDITDNSVLLSFFALKDGNTLDLTTVQASTILASTTRGGGSASTRHAAAIFDNITSGANTEVDAFIGYLQRNLSSTDTQVSDAIASTLPSIAASTPTVSTQVVNTMSSVVQARQSSVRGFSSGDIAFSDKNMWIKPFAGYAKQDNKNGISGFDATIYGFGMGIDGEYTDGHRAGLAVFYTTAKVDLNDATQSSDLGVLNLIGYGSQPILDDKSLLFYQVGFGLQNSQSNRAIAGTGTATSDYDSKSFFAQVKVTRTMQLGERTTFVPALKTAYKYFSNPDYAESGVGGMGLAVKSFTSKEILLGFELDINHKINESTDLLANIGMAYDFENNAQSVTSGYQGTPGVTFTTTGIENSAFTYEAGFGIAKKLQQDLMLDIKYDLSGRGSDFKNHAISAKVNYKF